MDDLSALAPEAGPEVEANEALETTEGQAEGQTAELEPEGEGEDKKTAASQRREREKAQKERLRAERDRAIDGERQAQARLDRILAAGKADQAPREADYSDPLEYVAVKAAWLTEQKRTGRDAGEAAEAVQTARKVAQEIDAKEREYLAEKWVQDASTAKSRYADFEAVVSAPGLFPVGSAIVPMIQQSDVAADLAYAIASDRLLHDQLVNMTPVEAARVIGRLEAAVTLPRPRMSTNAPAPITPVRGNGGATLNPDKMSMDDYIAARRAGKLK